MVAIYRWTIPYSRRVLACACITALLSTLAAARGVTPYLPLDLEPEMQRLVERALILADRPILSRPIAAATVRDALPLACQRDRPLCERVARYLARLAPDMSLDQFSAEIATESGDEIILANRHGLPSTSTWNVSALAHWQPRDHALLAVGGVAYDGNATPTGSLLSLGWDVAQVDIGYRDHQYSPFTDSAMLISSHAPTLASASVSNYRALTRLGIRYDVFVSELSRSKYIAFQDRTTTGRPLLAGTHISVEPASGYSLGVNRLIQFGGGERGGRSLSEFWSAYFNPSKFDNTSNTLNADQQLGNQLGSFTSRLIYPGSTPFAVYFEYAGEDTSSGRNYLLGNSALSVGLDFPDLPYGLDLTLELSEWQNGWYVNSVYGDGLTNEQRGLGHWLVDRRRTGDAVGGQSQMLRVGWQPRFGGDLEFRYRTLANERYSGFDYQRSHELSLTYSRRIADFSIGAELQGGRDVYGESWSRAAAFFRYTGSERGVAGWLDDTADTIAKNGAELFAAAGVAANRVRIDLDEGAVNTTDARASPHLAFGMRRPAGVRGNVGARIEFDEVDGRTMIGVRAVDYHYQLADRLAVGGFLGAARYDLATPAYGIYFGVGAEWRDVMPGWSAGVDLKYAAKVARDRVLPSEVGQFERVDAFYDVAGASAYLMRRF
ncbi:MAG: hypothetical protein KDI32_05710 [Pseudomonadales bacterium]|nr:hypothetical protein [Pseudomonadales bacterium]